MSKSNNSSRASGCGMALLAGVLTMAAPGFLVAILLQRVVVMNDVGAIALIAIVGVLCLSATIKIGNMNDGENRIKAFVTYFGLCILVGILLLVNDSLWGQFRDEVFGDKPYTSLIQSIPGQIAFWVCLVCIIAGAWNLHEYIHDWDILKRNWDYYHDVICKKEIKGEHKEVCVEVVGYKSLSPEQKRHVDGNVFMDDVVSLKNEPGNPVNPHAMQVMHEGVKIGYVEDKSCELLHKLQLANALEECRLQLVSKSSDVFIKMTVGYALMEKTIVDKDLLSFKEIVDKSQRKWMGAFGFPTRELIREVKKKDEYRGRFLYAVVDNIDEIIIPEIIRRGYDIEGEPLPYRPAPDEASSSLASRISERLYKLKQWYYR